MNKGKLTLITGAMFSGKTTFLLRHITIAQKNGCIYAVFKHSLDDRYAGKAFVTSHDGLSTSAHAVRNSEDLKECTRAIALQSVFVDEIQFFDPSIVVVVQDLLDRGVNVFAAGLAFDFKAEPFGMMPQLADMARSIIRVTGRCHVCGGEGTHTQRLVNGSPARKSDPVILVGGSESYQCRCVRCFKLGD